MKSIVFVLLIKLVRGSVSCRSKLTIDTLVQTDEEVILYLKTKGLKNWRRLYHFVDSAYKVDLATVLYNRLSFQLDKANCSIVTKTQDAVINIRQINNVVDTETRKTLGPGEIPALSSQYHFEEFTQSDSSLVLDVMNAVNAITQEGYFEHIQIAFTFNKLEKGTYLTYMMEGKYGAGIIWAPHQSRYRPLKPKYQEQIALFNNKIGNRINDEFL